MPRLNSAGGGGGLINFATPDDLPINRCTARMRASDSVQYTDSQVQWWNLTSANKNLGVAGAYETVASVSGRGRFICAVSAHGTLNSHLSALRVIIDGATYEKTFITAQATQRMIWGTLPAGGGYWNDHATPVNARSLMAGVPFNESLEVQARVTFISPINERDRAGCLYYLEES